MITLVPFVLFAYVFLYAIAFSIPVDLRSSQRPLYESLALEKTDLGPQSSLDAWIEQEEKIALDKLLRNIAPGGANTQGAAPGTVIASPSKSHPNYYYQWIRDAAITIGTLVDIYTEDPSSYLSSKISPLIEAYSSFSQKIQHTSNPSGSFNDLSGLGEPKFHVDGSSFTDNWGRPQRDGPPLRAITLIRFLQAYNASHQELWVSGDKNPYADFYDADMPANSTIKADLEYTSHFWHQSGFDLWEEIQGLHFFTAIVQLRAMREGARLASLFRDPGAAKWYTAQADKLEYTLMPRFWSEGRGHLVETLDFPRSGLDCGILLGAIHGTPTTCSTNPSEAAQCAYAPYSDEILTTLLELIRDQRHRFPINSTPQPAGSTTDFDPLAGVGIGRYPEDAYDGYEAHPNAGNPWFLCTSSAAEVLYRTKLHLQHTSSLTITPRGEKFWRALLLQDNIEVGREYRSSDPTFNKALERLEAVADAFLAVVRKHVDGAGSMSEQFDRGDGFMRGATDLTWSYGAFLQAVRMRKIVK